MAVLLHAGDVAVEFAAGMGIEAGRRLVEKDDLGIVDERQRQGEPLLLPAGQRIERRVRLLGERETIEQGLRRRSARIEAAVQRERLTRRDLVLEGSALESGADLLLHFPRPAACVDPTHLHDAAVGLAQADHALDGRRLPRAIRAEQAEDFTLGDLEAHSVDGPGPVVLLAELLDDDVWHRLLTEDTSRLRGETASSFQLPAPSFQL